MQLTGIHHLTAVSAKPRENLAFYTGLLGISINDFVGFKKYIAEIPPFIAKHSGK